MPSGTRAPRTSWSRVTADHGQLKVTVSDDGVGIDPAVAGMVSACAVWKSGRRS